MKEHTRRAVAYIVLQLAAGNKPNLPAIRDLASGKAFRFNADVAPTKTKITIFDQEQKCHVKGAGGGGFYTLTHEGNGKPISLKIKDNRFEGFDYDTGKPYNGMLNGNLVSIHDAEHAKEFRYTASPF